MQNSLIFQTWKFLHLRGAPIEFDTLGHVIAIDAWKTNPWNYIESKWV